MEGMDEGMEGIQSKKKMKKKVQCSSVVEL